MQHCGILSLFLSLFWRELLTLFPCPVSSHHPPTLLPCLLYHFLLLSTAAPSLLPFFARSQERRYLLRPLCRSLAVCQTELMPIKAMSNGLKLLHSLCFPLFPMANKFVAGLNQREKLEHTADVQSAVQHKDPHSLITDKSWGGSHWYDFPCEPLCLLTGGGIIVWADKHTVCHETIAAPGLSSTPKQSL